MNRREFVKLTAMAAAATMVPWRRAIAFFNQSPALQKFVQPLRTLGQMAPATKLVYGDPGVDYYQIAMRQFTDNLYVPDPASGAVVPAGWSPTKLWGYADKGALPGTERHLGGAIIAQQNRPVRISFFNELPNAHFLPIDNTVPALIAQPGAPAFNNRAAVHLHGGHVPWPSDGGPYHWFAPDPVTGLNVYGSSVPFVTDPVTGAITYGWLPDPTGALTNDYWYPNDESARLMWYHDHAVGNTRINAYAGLATGYIVRDQIEAGLIANGMIPAREIPLVIQDKVFNPDGSLWYPSQYDVDFFVLNPLNGQGGPALPLPPTSLVPEFWGDTMLVNGTIAPYLEVEPRRYRFRILNACNTRFLSLRVMKTQGTTFPLNAEVALGAQPVPMILIGNEGGFIDGGIFPQGVSVGLKQALKKGQKRPTQGFVPSATVGPAERLDVIVDFSAKLPGETFILYNDAPVPFPAGTPLADFDPGNLALAMPPAPGFTPNTRTLLQFRVVPLAGAADPIPAPLQLPGRQGILTDQRVPTPPAGTVVRNLTLNEAFDEYGRLMQLIGGMAFNPLSGGFGSFYNDAATEAPLAGATEVWNIFNISADAHPIHFHLANAQVVSRYPFDPLLFTGAIPAPLGPARGPDPDEIGFKETIKMLPGECTTIVMNFALPATPKPGVIDPVTGLVVKTPAPIPLSPRTGGHEYVYHCHILEHEEHDMMRPLIVF